MGEVVDLLKFSDKLYTRASMKKEDGLDYSKEKRLLVKIAEWEERFRAIWGIDLSGAPLHDVR